MCGKIDGDIYIPLQVFLCHLLGIGMEIYFWIAIFTSKILRPHPSPLSLHCKDKKNSPDFDSIP